MNEADDQLGRTREALNQLDVILQHRSRLGACVLLGGVDALSFARLRALLNETDGNLGAQLRKLQEAGYVAVKKEFVNRKPVSWYSLTENGKAALRRHFAALESMMQHNGNGRNQT